MAVQVGCVGIISGGPTPNINDDGGGSGDGGGPRADGGPVPPIPDITAWAPMPCGGNVTCVGPGDSILSAADGAADNGIIQVAAGTYNETVRVEGKPVTLVGGLSADFTTWDPTGNATIVIGGEGGGFSLQDAGGSKVVGFVVRGGNGTCENRCEGGGIFAQNGLYEIVGNVVEDNSVPEVDGQGGGISLRGGGLIQGNVVRNNTGGRGAGISVSNFDGPAIVADNIVENNRGLSDHGGGLYLTGEDVTLARNTIRGNVTGINAGYGWGGGVLFYGGVDRVTIGRSVGNIITDNQAPSIGSGLFVDDDTSVVSENDLIYDNRCTETGGIGIYVDHYAGGTRLELVNTTISENRCAGQSAVYIEGVSTIDMRNSIVWGNGPAFEKEDRSTVLASYSIVTGGYAGEGNLDQDPLFADQAGGDFHLRSAAGRLDGAAYVNDPTTSPALNRAVPADAYDLEPDPNGGRRDLGHTGNTPEASRSE